MLINQENTDKYIQHLGEYKIAEVFDYKQNPNADYIF